MCAYKELISLARRYHGMAEQFRERAKKYRDMSHVKDAAHMEDIARRYDLLAWEIEHIVFRERDK